MLRDEIDSAQRTVRTDRVQITIGELASLYTSGELDVLPDFQRLFRWSTQKKSDFIESILIGIPIPPAFVFEKENGYWELIDGLQRISTVLEFMGVLKDPETHELRSSTLEKTKYLPALDGVVWERVDGEGNIADNSLPKALQLLFRRHRFDFQVLKHPSDNKAKFDLFQRLNRGGAYANEQEVRTCAMVMANKEFTAKIRDAAGSDLLVAMCRVTPDGIAEQRNIEYLVRAICLMYFDFQVGLDVEDFFDARIMEVMETKSAAEVLGRIEEALKLLHSAGGNDVLIPTPGHVEGIQKRFAYRALEVILVGVLRNLDAIKAQGDAVSFINRQINRFWKDKKIVAMSAKGLKGSDRLRRTVPYGSDLFNPANA